MADATRDAVAANPGEYLAGYRFTDAAGGAVSVPATLRDQTILAAVRWAANGVLCLVPRPDGVPQVRVLHHFMRYLDLPGEHPTGYHNRVLALLVGDVRPMQYPVVEVPPTAFHLAGAGAVRIPTAPAMEGIMAGWVLNDENLGPFLEADDDTVVVAQGTCSCSQLGMPPSWSIAMVSLRRRPTWNWLAPFMQTVTIWRVRMCSLGSAPHSPLVVVEARSLSTHRSFTRSWPCTFHNWCTPTSRPRLQPTSQQHFALAKEGRRDSGRTACAPSGGWGSWPPQR